MPCAPAHLSRGSFGLTFHDAHSEAAEPEEGQDERPHGGGRLGWAGRGAAEQELSEVSPVSPESLFYAPPMVSALPLPRRGLSG